MSCLQTVDILYLLNLLLPSSWLSKGQYWTGAGWAVAEGAAEDEDLGSVLFRNVVLQWTQPPAPLLASMMLIFLRQELL